MSKFLDKDVAKQTFELHREELEGMILEETGRKGFHVVILDPAVPYLPQMGTINPNSILFEYSYNQMGWAGSKYKEIAEGKALLCQREKMHSGDVPAHCLKIGDVRYQGGVYYKGIVVAISGFISQVDHNKSLAIAHDCAIAAIAKFDEWKKIHDKVAFV